MSNCFYFEHNCIISCQCTQAHPSTSPLLHFSLQGTNGAKLCPSLACRLIWSSDTHASAFHCCGSEFLTNLALSALNPLGCIAVCLPDVPGETTDWQLDVQRILVSVNKGKHYFRKGLEKQVMHFQGTLQIFQCVGDLYCRCR